ncbi:hypothetical protein [Providencia rettgeri]|uniref:hypothetical protein n=1 Tax=Providencia rettgeri TaxID=587 RepID=UPI0023601507|nr:hypothetical protein [Providencia rettgeri]
MGQQLSKFLGGCCLALMFILGLVAYLYDGANNENKSLNSQLSASQFLNKVTQSTITLHYQVSLDNIKAKQLEDSEHVKIKTVIKTALKDNECANADISDELTNELRKYERDLRARAASADTSSLNR